MNWFCYCLALRAYDSTNLVCLAATILDYSKLRSGCVNHAVFLERLGFAVCQNPYPTRVLIPTPILPELLYFWQNLTGYWFQGRGGGPAPFFQRALSNRWGIQFVNPMCLLSVFWALLIPKFKDTPGLQKALNGTWRSSNILLWHFFLKREAAVHIA